MINIMEQRFLSIKAIQKQNILLNIISLVFPQLTRAILKGQAQCYIVTIQTKIESLEKKTLLQQ